MMPETHIRVVVLPAPFDPIMVTISPCFTSSETPESTSSGP